MSPTLVTALDEYFYFYIDYTIYIYIYVTIYTYMYSIYYMFYVRHQYAINVRCFCQGMLFSIRLLSPLRFGGVGGINPSEKLSWDAYYATVY